MEEEQQTVKLENGQEVALSPGETKIFVKEGDDTEWGEVAAQHMPWRKYRKTALAEAVVVLRPFKVVTLEGTFEAKAGDYLMRGPAGELYSCDAEIFENTYELVAEAEATADEVYEAADVLDTEGC